MNDFVAACGAWFGAAMLVSATVAVTIGAVSWCIQPRPRTRHVLWVVALLLMVAARLYLLQPARLPSDFAAGAGEPTVASPVAAVAAVTAATRELPPILLQLIGGLLLTAFGLQVARVTGRVWQGHRMALRLRSQALSAPDDLYAEWERLGASRATLVVVPGLHTAALVGIWRPIVAVPAEWVERLTREELHLVLAHEAAHVVAHDDWILLACELASCLLVLDPFALVARRESAAAREMACDEAACHGRVTVPKYARMLLGLHDALPQPGLIGIELGGFRPQLVRRVETLLTPRRSGSPHALRQLGAVPMAIGGSILAASFALAAGRSGAAPLHDRALNDACVVDQELAAALTPGEGLLAIADAPPGQEVPCIAGGVAFARRVDPEQALRLLGADSNSR